jgi:hypothetical protein
MHFQEVDSTSYIYSILDKYNYPSGNFFTKYKLPKDSVKNDFPNSVNTEISPEEIEYFSKDCKKWDISSTYLLESHEADESLLRQSEKSLSNTTTSKKENNNLFLKKDFNFESINWILGVLLFALILLAWAKFAFKKHLTLIFQSLADPKALYNQTKLKKALNVNKRAYRLYYFLFTINSGLFVYMAFDLNNILFFESIPFLRFLVFAGIIFLIFGLKVLIFDFLGFIFKFSEQINEYKSKLSLNLQAFGLSLIPLLILMPFVSAKIANIFVYIGISSFAILYLSSIYRGIQIIFKK